MLSLQIVIGSFAMPGPTAKTNPWAEELKKSRRRSRKGLNSSVSGKDEAEAEAKEASIASPPAPAGASLTLSETKETMLEKQEKAASLGDETVKKCVKDSCSSSTAAVGRPPKVKPPSLPVDDDSRSIYQDARSQLRPVVARMLSRQMSQDKNNEMIEEDDDNPVDKMIRQGSSQAGIKGSDTLNSLGLFLPLLHGR